MVNFRWGMRACGIFILWAGAAIALPAQTLTTLYSFCSQFNCSDGADPYAALVQATNGDFYGTTAGGGANGAGAVFKITSSGTLQTIYSFCPGGGSCTDGFSPQAGLVQGTNGKFYGTTRYDGASGLGTVFSITASGTLTTLHSFDGGTDGGTPLAGLVQGTNGKFYGTTEQGGVNGGGTVFGITSGGILTTLHSFAGTDGADPFAGLFQGIDGNFYGTTGLGGANNDGTVFKITPGGRLTVLHSFRGMDGSQPVAGLVQGTDGNFYGTTQAGGANNDGTVFKITPSGRLTPLHSFDGTDGDLPSAALIQGTDGNFYGTTYTGGANNDGTIFNITATGALTTLHSFAGYPTDGSLPLAGLIQGTSGTFYGTTDQGGAIGAGTVFSLSVGLGPFAEIEPTFGPVGAAVTILGTNLTGTTSVTFNGTAATFTVKSRSEITTTVPAGATTGTVQVATPGGTLLSNVPFTVN